MDTKNYKWQTNQVIYHVTLCFGQEKISVCPFSYVRDFPRMADFLSVLYGHPLFLLQCAKYQRNNEYQDNISHQNVLSTKLDGFWSNRIERYHCIFIVRFTVFFKDSLWAGQTPSTYTWKKNYPQGINSHLIAIKSCLFIKFVLHGQYNMGSIQQSGKKSTHIKQIFKKSLLKIIYLLKIKYKNTRQKGTEYIHCRSGVI